MTAALEVHDAWVRFGAVDAVAGVSLVVEAGTIVGLIGPNGAGKTSLLDAVSGVGPLERGTVALGDTRIDGLPAHRRARAGLGRTFQSLELFEDLTVGENLAVAAEAMLTSGGGATGAAVSEAAEAAGVGELVDRVPSELDHGIRKRVALARALVGRPPVVLLDEPAGGLDGTERAELARTLRDVAATGAAILVVDHDMDLVLGVCERLYVLDLGVVVAAGTPAEVRGDSRVAEAYLGAAAVDGPISPGDRAPAGEVVVRAERMCAGYGGVPVVRHLDVEVRAGEVVALLGANGAGKTTTLGALSGLVAVTSGSVDVLGGPARGRPDELARRGLAHAPQDRGVLAALTVEENLRLAARFDRAGVRGAYDALPALRGLSARRAGNLSGGEQQLVALGRVVAARPKAVLLDELSLGLGRASITAATAAVRALAAAGAGVLVVEQHPAVALALADRACVLRRGEIVLSGTAAELRSRRRDLEAAYLG